MGLQLMRWGRPHSGWVTLPQFYLSVNDLSVTPEVGLLGDSVILHRLRLTAESNHNPSHPCLVTGLGLFVLEAAPLPRFLQLPAPALFSWFQLY